MVVGEDFWLRIPMNNESAGRHLCMDDVEVIHAWLESGYGGCWTLPLETDGEQLEGVAVKVPGSRLGLGTYAVVMAGKFVNGGHFRTKRQLFIRLVDREEQADAKPTMFNEEKAYWAGPAVLSGMLSRDGLNTYELAVLHGYDGTLEQFLAQAGIELQDFMVTKAKLSREVQTQLDKGSEKAINPAGDYDAEAEYSVNEMVYDEVTNSSYVSKQSVNVGHAVTDTDWWMKVLDGNYVHTTIQAIMTAAQATLDEAKQDTIDATAAALAAKQDTEQATAAANAVAAQKVADAQIGYYVCETAAGTATKQTTSDVIGEDHFAVPYAGGAVKIKMEHANTSTDAVYLQFGTNTNTKRKLYYNGEDVSQSNTWDDGEVISVYLDPAANNGAGGYMASNAQGGGASSKKVIPPTATGKKIATNGTSIGSVSTDENYQYAKYAVNEGDYVMISGAGVSTYRLWAIAKANNDIIDNAEASVVEENLLIKIPADGKWIVINNNNVLYPNPEWYHIKAGKDAHELLTESYLRRGTIRLKLGQPYDTNQNVKTADGEQLRMTKEVGAMNLFGEVAIGDLMAHSNNTYEAQKAVSLYDGTKNPYYTEGDYAIGRPATATIAFTADSATIEALTEAVPITVNIVGNACTVDVTSASDAASVATAVKDAFDALSVEGWELLDDENGTLILRSLTALKTTPTVTSSVGASGITITSTTAAGNDNLSQYDGSAWAAVSLATWVTDTSTDDPDTMWKTLTLDDLLAYTEQDYVSKLYGEFGNNDDGSISQEVVTNELFDYSQFDLATYGKKNTRAINIENGKWDNQSGAQGWIFLFPAKKGQVFKIKARNSTGTQYTFLHSYNVAKNTDADYAAGYTTTVRISAGDTVYVEAPEGAAYLYVLWATGGTAYSVESVGVRYPKLEKIEEDVAELKSIPITSLGYTTTPQGVAGNEISGSKETWSPSSTYYGYWFNVTDYVGCYIKFNTTPSRCMFTSIKPTNESEAPIPGSMLGEGVVFNSGRYIRIPNPREEGGEVWFWIYTHSNSGTFYSISDIFILQKDDSVAQDLDDTLDDNLLYYRSNLIKKARYTNDNKTAFGLLHFSDLHGDDIAFVEINNYISKYKELFDDIIETGDRVYLTSSNYIMPISNDILFALGNHDGATESGGHSDGKGKQWCFNNFFASHLEAWGVGTEDGVQMPEGYNVEGDPHQYAMYWYKDYADVRLITLDCMHHLGRDNNLTDESQELWFKDTLDDAKVKGKKVIVACHYYLDHWNGDYERWNDTTHKWEYNFVTDLENNTGGRVMDAATGKPVHFHIGFPTDLNTDLDKTWSSMSIVQNGTEYPTGTNRFGDILSEWIAGGGDFVAWICGHTHINLMFYPTKYPNILNITVPSAGTRRNSGALNSREDGVIRRMCANAYFVNGDYLSVIRVGWNQSYRTLIPFNWITINYKTGEVISEG